MTKLVVHILLSLTINGTVHAGWPSGCKSLLDTLRTVITRTRNHFSAEYQNNLRQNTLTTSEKAELNGWLEKYAPRREKQFYVHVLDVQAFLALSDLPESIRKKLFTLNGKSLLHHELFARLRSFGIESPSNHPIFAEVVRYTYNPSAGDLIRYEYIEDYVADSLHQSEEAITALRSDLVARYDSAEILSHLLDNYSPAYEVQIKANHVVFPEGTTYPIVGRKKNGDLLLEFPAHLTRGMQGRADFYIDVYLKYMRRSDATLLGISANFSPEGYLYVSDGHHRSAAYRTRHKEVFRAYLRPSLDGKYYTLTHFFLMSHFEPQWDTYWLGMKHEERQSWLEEVRSGSYEKIRELYQKFYVNKYNAIPRNNYRAPIGSMGNRNRH